MDTVFDYSSFFELEENEKLKKVVITTYSFDISLLPLIWLYAGKEGRSIKYLERFANREFYKNVFADYIDDDGYVTVFYQEDLMTNSSLRDNELTRAVLNYRGLYPQKTDGKICFHPKMILLEVRRDDGSGYYKLAVLSRNLTKSESPEAAVVLKREYGQGERLLSETMSGIKDGGERNADNNFDIFMKCVQKSGWKMCRKDTVDGLWKVIEQPESISAEVFIQKTGDPGSVMFKRMLNKERGNITEAYIISPGFNKNGVLEQLSNPGDNKSCFFASLTGGPDRKKVPTHEKIYVFKRENGSERRYEIWTGSSNCSARGLGDRENFNTECMVCLTFTEKSHALWEGYVSAVRNGYDFKDQWEDEDPDDLEVENGKEYFELCGKIMKFIHGTKIRVSGNKNDNGNYDLSITVKKKDKNGNDISLKEYAGKIGLRFAVASEMTRFISVTDDEMKFEIKDLPGKSVSNEISVLERDGNVTVSRITKADFEKELRNELHGIFKDTLLAISRKYKKNKQYFPIAREGGEVYNETQRGSGTGSPVFSEGDGDYEKLMKVYAIGGKEETEKYISFWEDMYENDEETRNLINAVKQICN
ncbi:MAG: hypothetical protein K5770_13530 [Lachnospiraceae bacterium]|nr:hypothetical protein [Lachnospiraceae bacterium]